MRNYLMTAMLVATLGAMPVIVGCDRTVHEADKTTTSPNGAQSTTDSKTVQHPDGSTTTEKNSSTTPPAPAQ